MKPSRTPAALLLLAAAFAAGGCRTPAPAPVDLTAPGWEVRETEAAWHPRAAKAGIAGELLVARHPDGRRLVQFSKQGLPLVSAGSGPEGWTLQSPMRPGIHGGRGHPPARVVWFALDTLPPAAREAGPWRTEQLPDGRWRITHRRTGEHLEGVAP